jgi:RNA polymerase sigma-70 factor (ECF subfamily)
VFGVDGTLGAAFMLSTSHSLFEEIQASSDGDCWQRFVQLYTPVLGTWAERLGLSSTDAQDLVQDVFALLVRKIGLYRREEQGRFRDWLRTVLTNRYRERGRKRAPELAALNPVDDKAEDPAEAFWEEEYQRLVVARALEFLRDRFEERVWRAFWLTTVEGRSTTDAADELGMSAGAVYVARSRVLTKLRREFDGFLE